MNDLDAGALNGLDVWRPNAKAMADKNRSSGNGNNSGANAGDLHFKNHL